MNIEEIKKRLEGLKEYGSGLADEDYNLYQDIQNSIKDTDFLLEQNQRLVEALKQIEWLKQIDSERQADFNLHADSLKSKVKKLAEKEKDIESLQKENQRLVEALEAAKEQLDNDDHENYDGEKWVKCIETTQGYKKVVEALKLLERKEK